jgi:transcriptional regulator with XRE-family HTH domain
MARGRSLAEEEIRDFGLSLMLLLLDYPKFRTRTGNVAWGEFARALEARSGVAYSTLRKAVAGERRPSVELMEAVAECLNIDPNEFHEFRLAQARAALDPEEQGGGEDGLRKAVANLGEWEASAPGRKAPRR